MSTPTLSKSAQILILLLRKQEQGKLDWQETELDGVYQVAFPDFALRLFEREGRDESRDFVISIFDGEGKLIDEFTDVTVQNEFDKSFSAMQGLYEKARRGALGVEKALDQVIDNLEAL